MSCTHVGIPPVTVIVHPFLRLATMLRVTWVGDSAVPQVGAGFVPCI